MKVKYPLRIVFYFNEVPTYIRNHLVAFFFAK